MAQEASHAKEPNQGTKSQMAYCTREELWMQRDPSVACRRDPGDGF